MWTEDDVHGLEKHGQKGKNAAGQIKQKHAPEVALLTLSEDCDVRGYLCKGMPSAIHSLHNIE